jgi:hypothetical protein
VLISRAVVAHTFNPSTREAEAEAGGFLSSGSQRNPVSKKQKTKSKKQKKKTKKKKLQNCSSTEQAGRAFGALSSEGCRVLVCHPTL